MSGTAVSSLVWWHTHCRHTACPVPPLSIFFLKISFRFINLKQTIWDLNHFTLTFYNRRKCVVNVGADWNDQIQHLSQFAVTQWIHKFKKRCKCMNCKMSACHCACRAEETAFSVFLFRAWASVSMGVSLERGFFSQITDAILSIDEKINCGSHQKHHNVGNTDFW